MAGSLLILEEAPIRAAGDEHQLHPVVVQNVLRAFFHAQPKEELHLFVADLHHIRLPKAPQKLPLGLFQITPQGLSQIGIVGHQLALFFGVGHRSAGGGTGRLVGEGQGSNGTPSLPQ